MRRERGGLPSGGWQRERGELPGKRAEGGGGAAGAAEPQHTGAKAAPPERVTQQLRAGRGRAGGEGRVRAGGGVGGAASPGRGARPGGGAWRSALGWRGAEAGGSILLSAARQAAHAAESPAARALPTEKPPGKRPGEEGLSPGFPSEFGARGSWFLSSPFQLAPGFRAKSGGNPVEIPEVVRAGSPCRIHLVPPLPAGRRHPILKGSLSLSFFF